MKHVKLYICLLMLFTYLICSAQNNDTAQVKEEKIKTELGINVTGLLSSIIDFTEDRPVEDPFDFALKRVKGNEAFRLHFGITGIKERDDNDLDQKNFFTNTNLKLGKEWRRNMANRFDLFYGFDFSLGYKINKVTAKRANDEISFTEQDIQFGPSIFLGAIFHINKSICISTQAGFEFLYNYNHQRTKDERRFVTDEVMEVKTFNFETHVPKILYLFFRF